MQNAHITNPQTERHKTSKTTFEKCIRFPPPPPKKKAKSLNQQPRKPKSQTADHYLSFESKLSRRTHKHITFWIYVSAPKPTIFNWVKTPRR